VSLILRKRSWPFGAFGKSVLAVFCVLFIGAVFFSPAYAQQNAPSDSQAISAIAGSCPQGSDFTGPVVANCDCYPGLANRVVGCIRQTLHNASEVFFDPDRGMHSILARAIMALITLGVAIYGVMIVSGQVEKLNRDTFTLLIKITLVTYFVVNTQMLYEMILVAIDSLATSVFQFSSTGLFGVCMQKFSVWERMDCMIDSVIGIRTSEITSASFKGFNEKFIGETMQRGLIATFFELMKSSSFGLLIGAMGFVFIYTMLFFVVRVLFTFLISFISLTFLLMIGPIFIPLIIFRATKQFFDKWIRLIISSALQPIVLVAFITFAVAAMDLAMFTGPTAITRVIAGNAVDQPNFSLTQYIDQFLVRDAVPGPEPKGDSSAQDFQRVTGTIKGIVEASSTNCISNTVGFVTQRIRPGAGGAGGGGSPGNVQGAITDMVACTRSQVSQLPYDAIDMAQLAAARVPPVVDPAQLAGLSIAEQTQLLEQQMTQELFASVAVGLMIMFLLMSLMKIVPILANDLTGEYRYTPGLFVGGGSNQLGSSVSRQISASFSSLSGSSRNSGSG
jgi:hypothetical protein